MHLLLTLVFLLHLMPTEGRSVANILRSTYSSGSAFAQMNVSKTSTCLCSCFDHPHCLSISVTRSSIDSYLCQLFATYPSQPEQLSPSSISNVSVYTDRALRSARILQNNKLINPSNLFINNSNVPWIPLFLLRAGNNQAFLWLNSSSASNQTAIPDLFNNSSTDSHWFSVLVSQWNQNRYRPRQVALAFFLNQSFIIDFLVFNASESTIFSWFSITRLLSAEFWTIRLYQNTAIGQTQMRSIYQDSDVIRSFNANFKYSSNGCSMDFYGYFFVHGGYIDRCLGTGTGTGSSSNLLGGVATPIYSVPTIFYSPSSNHTNGNVNQYRQAMGLMGFVR